MKAKIESIINKKRTALQDVLPLQTPYSIFIDVCNACNFNCKFCAVQHAKERRGYGASMMNFELFAKIIDDLCEFGEKSKILRLYGNGEPFLNKDFPRMLKYAKSKNVSEWIETVTNGSMLNPVLNRELIQGGIDRIRISVEGVNAETYREVAAISLDFDSFVENIKDLYDHRGSCEIYIKTVDTSVNSEEKREKFFKTFGDICDKIMIENVSSIWPGYDELSEHFELSGKALMDNSKTREVKVCPFPCYQMFINSDGTVLPCCADWQRRLILGNVKNESLVQIWNGGKYYRLQKDMLKQGKHCRDVCSICSYPNYAAVDNIDDYAEKILCKLENN